MPQEKKYKSCPVCGGMSSRDLSFGGYYFAGEKLPLVLCDNCDLQYVRHHLNEKEISSFYNESEYFKSEYAGGGQTEEYAASRQDQEEKAARVLNIIKKIRPNGKLIEIGCAGGYFCALARDRYGYDVKGVELSEEMGQWGRQNLGLDIFTGSIFSAPLSWSGFSVAYLGDVLEHVSDPITFVGEIKSRLVTGGILVLELPFTYNWTLSGFIIGLANMFRGRFGRKYFLPAQHRKNFVPKPPYHLLMFTRKSLKTFLEKQGFRVLYLKIYEGEPKDKFGRSFYSSLKQITHWLTWFLPQSFLGDRCLVIAELKK